MNGKIRDSPAVGLVISCFLMKKLTNPILSEFDEDSIFVLCLGRESFFR